jgi:hypothetical protein
VLTAEPSQETEFNQDAAPFLDSKETAAPEPAITPPTRVDEGETRSVTEDELKAPESDADLPEKESSAPDRHITVKRDRPSFVGNFEVVQDSFLRDKPESAATTTILPPGTRVRVESKLGNYLRVRSLDDPELRGYVHREDAFFERIR